MTMQTPETDEERNARQFRESEEWEEKWRRVARRPLSAVDETRAWRIARYTLVGGGRLETAEATALAAAYLQLLAQVGRAGLPEED